jgi:hypothetical protein
MWCNRLLAQGFGIAMTYFVTTRASNFQKNASAKFPRSDSRAAKCSGFFFS